MSRYPQARKRFGQHFLHDPAVIARLIRAIDPKPGDRIVEIGPGTGVMTRPLLEATGRLDVIEIDRDLAAGLPERVGDHGELVIHCGDALKIDFEAFRNGNEKLRVVGNLPYNISTPLLFRLLSFKHAIMDMHFMVQKEVAERITANPGGGDYGRLTVMLAAACKSEKLFTIGAGAFQPPPRVTSAFIRLTPWEEPPFRPKRPEVYARVVAQAFSMRRKQIRNSLGGLLDADQLIRLGIDPAARPETLAPAQFAKIADAIEDR